VERCVLAQSVDQIVDYASWNSIRSYRTFDQSSSYFSKTVSFI